jgi:parallel beta-helix repeat protein
VYLAAAEQCVIEDCTLRNTGKYAVCLAGGRNNAVLGNEIAHSAEGGVLLLGSAGNTVSDNHIHHLGAAYKHIGGVILEGPGTDDNRVAHNWIHDSSRYGISLKNPGRRNVIEYNRVERTNTETYDTGGIEVTQGNREFRSGSVISHNIVGDTIGYSCRASEPMFLSWSIYLDSFAGGYDVHHNIVYRDHDGGIMFQGGKDNRVTNNIFVDGELRQGCLSNFAQNSSGLVLQRNIFCYSNPNATLFSTGKLSPGVITVDYNLYWHHGAEIRTGWGARQTLTQWREQGYDQHSIVADPRFVDPKHDNYALRPDSPALGLGFEPIDTSRVGPRRHRP